MEVCGLKLKLDENLSHHLSARLRLLGHDVDSVADENLISHPDERIAAAAKAVGRVLLTLDLDFSDIRRFPIGTHPGIVLFRPRSFAFRELNSFVESFVSTTDMSDLAGCLVVVDFHKVRVRRPSSETSEEGSETP